MRTPLALPLSLALACVTPEDDGLRKCDGDLCVEIFRGLYTTEPCPGATAEACTYVDVFFVLDRGDEHVRDLAADGVAMSINDRDVGVEGNAALTQENGLLVTLLLDRSYSITEAGATQDVREAAKGFIDTLPDEAVVSVAAFASEPDVPTMLGEGGQESTTTGVYYPVGTSRALLDSIVDMAYQPYETPSSSAFTKLHDAVAHLADFRPTDPSYQALQSVAIVFTDGADTASTLNPSAADAIAHVGDVAPDMKVYAIGLGDEIDAAALHTLSEGRSYHAANAGQLQTAFNEVAADLGAIYQLRILVAEQEYDARATLSISYGGRRLETSFDLMSVGGGGSDESGPVDDGDPPDPPISPTCQLPCATSADCSAGEVCASTLNGWICLPAECQTCFDVGLTCSSYSDTCLFDACV